MHLIVIKKDRKVNCVAHGTSFGLESNGMRPKQYTYIELEMSLTKNEVWKKPNGLRLT